MSLTSFSAPGHRGPLCGTAGGSAKPEYRPAPLRPRPRRLSLFVALRIQDLDAGKTQTRVSLVKPRCHLWMALGRQLTSSFAAPGVDGGGQRHHPGPRRSP